MFVNTRKTPTCFGTFHSTVLRGPYVVLCAVTLMSSSNQWKTSTEDGRMKSTEICKGFFCVYKHILTF